MYDLASRDGYCFLAHEGQTKRGSSEIASHVNVFLQRMDDLGFKEVSLFSDGCCGQNKNSIVPTMMLSFVQSKSVKSVTLYFFETRHGQSEGDSMHSVMRRLSSVLEILLYLLNLSLSAKWLEKNPTPYKVMQVQSKDIADWKTFS